MSNGSGDRDGEPAGSKMIKNIRRRSRPIPPLIARQNSWIQLEKEKSVRNWSEFNQTEAQPPKLMELEV